MQYDFIFAREVGLRHTDEHSSPVGGDARSTCNATHTCQYVALLSVQVGVGDTQGPGCPSLSTSDENWRRADALVR